MAAGVSEIVAFAEEVNGERGTQQVRRIDIGGGLPVNFKSEEVTPTFAEYAEVLRAKVPFLFTDRYQVKTEFGRAIAAKNGFMITRVEYTKECGGRHIATTHAGAQVMTRTAFLPEAWPVRVAGFTPEGRPREGEIVAADVAGPCCFAADLVAKNVAMPRLAIYSAGSETGRVELNLIRRAATLGEVITNMS